MKLYISLLFIAVNNLAIGSGGTNVGLKNPESEITKNLKSPNKIEANEILNLSLKIKEYGRAANFLRVVADEVITKKVACGLTSAQALALLTPLKIHLDSQLDKLGKLSDPEFRDLLLTWGNCESECLCATYVNVLEGKDSHLFNKAHKKIVKYVEQKASQQGIKKSKKCALKNITFCESQLLEDLRKELGNEQ